MRRRAAEAGYVAAAAAIMIATVALPVLRHPSTRIFGLDIVGRHHDPFTMMQQFAAPVRASASLQPVTDLAGAALARIVGPVAAYNWLVLISFPLAAAAAYLLGRHLTLSPAAATFGALAYAFAPFHVAQAAYHPHVAQTQWLPLYLLALWRCLDEITWVRVGLLTAATCGVTLSNLYGGAIAALLTPIAIAGHVLAGGTPRAGAWRRAAITVCALAAIAAGAGALLLYAHGPVVAHLGWFAFPRADLFRYSAKWWSYLVPPVAHPWLGAASRRIWDAAGVREGLLEQQVDLGAGLVVLGLVAIVAWVRHGRADPALMHAPVLAAIALAALLCSLSPERTIGAVTVIRPSALLYLVAPMFRAYARFGAVVQLMAALLAGAGLDRLRRSRMIPARAAGGLLVALVAFEYVVSPAALSRDVLPTRAHRWAVQQSAAWRVLDCSPLTEESASVPWLTGSRVTMLSAAIDDCGEPNLAAKLAAEGYTHLLVRQANREGRAFLGGMTPPGLRLAARFRDAQIFAVGAAPPRIYTAAMTGFWPREYESTRTWRWMGAAAAWTVVNTEARPVVATLAVELSAFDHPRRMDLVLDGRPMQTMMVVPERRTYEAGPFLVAPGRHELCFQPIEPPLRASDVVATTDPRRLSYAVGPWTWTVRSEAP